jgi:hypothetical protein
MMEGGVLFFSVFLATILLTRIFLYLKPLGTPKLGNFRPHHWMTGLLIAAVALVISSLVLFAIGLVLFIDELTFLIMRGKSHADNYSTISLLGTMFFIVVIFLAKDYLAALFS